MKHIRPKKNRRPEVVKTMDLKSPMHETQLMNKSVSCFYNVAYYLCLQWLNGITTLIYSVFNDQFTKNVTLDTETYD